MSPDEVMDLFLGLGVFILELMNGTELDHIQTIRRNDVWNMMPALTHCGLMTPYSYIGLGQHWLR